MAKKVWFNWHCPHCEHRNRETFPFQFEIPQHYTAEWECYHCDKKSKVIFDLRVTSYYGKEKSFKARKKRRDKVDNKSEGTKKDRGYRNDRVKDIL